MKNLRNCLIITAAVLCNTGASAITIDGDWHDWISPSGDGSASDWEPNHPLLEYTVEDQSGSYLNPGYGGQAYDAEAMYLETSASNLYVAVITGRDPYAGGWRWGDIALDFGNDNSFEYGFVTLGDAGAHRSSGIGQSGELYAVDAWNLGIWNAPRAYDPTPDSEYAKAHPTSVKSGERLGTGEFAKAKMSGPVGELGGNHWFMEAAIPLDLFDQDLLSQPVDVHWTMGCANDWIQTDSPLPLQRRVPETPALPLLGLGLAGLLGMTRRRKGGGRGLT